MDNSSVFDGFTVTDFPTLEGLAAIPGRSSGGFVYAIFWMADGLKRPFYVGQTERLSERMSDYCRAAFGACTDFRVGEAIKYFRDNKNYQLVLKYKPTKECSKCERSIIRDLHLTGLLLLNDLCGYDYQTASIEEERQIVHRFCDALMKISK